MGSQHPGRHDEASVFKQHNATGVACVITFPATAREYHILDAVTATVDVALGGGAVQLDVAIDGTEVWRRYIVASNQYGEPVDFKQGLYAGPNQSLVITSASAGLEAEVHLSVSVRTDVTPTTSP